MKFLKQTQRPKVCRKFTAQEDPENTDPNLTKRSSNKHLPQHSQSMEIEKSLEFQGEEEVYQQTIITYLVEHAETLKVESNYFINQPDITEHMRAVLLNWLIDVHLKYKLQPETLFIATQILDAYLSKRVVSRNELQLVGITTLWIAAKYEETYQIPKLSNLVFICDSAYNREQILAMEGNIIQTLNFQLLTLTSFHYFQSLNRIVDFSPKDYYFCQYLLQITLFSLVFKKYHPRTIAASVVFFVNKLRKRQFCWPATLVSSFQISQQELKPCARDICTLWHRIQEIDNLMSLRSKFLAPQYKEVAKIKMGPPAPSKFTCPNTTGQLRA